MHLKQSSFLSRQWGDPQISISFIACGGCSSLSDFRAAIHKAKTSAAVAGAFFVFVARRRAVLVTYPSQKELESFVFQ